MYRSRLPPEVVQYALLEYPQAFTFKSLWQVHQHFGMDAQRTLEILDQAMALDCDEAWAICLGNHPNGMKARTP